MKLFTSYPMQPIRANGHSRPPQIAIGFSPRLWPQSQSFAPPRAFLGDVNHTRGGLRPTERALAKCRVRCSKQYGLIRRDQALGAPLTPRQIDTLVRSRRWLAVYRGIYADTAVPATWERSVLAAVFRGGHRSVASGRCAAALWGLPGFHRDPVEISSPMQLRNVPFTAHRVEIPDHATTRCRNIPITTVAKTLVDIAGSCSPTQVEDSLDDALRRRLTSLARLKLFLAGVDGRGRRGVKLLRQLVVDRDDNRPIPESVLETRLWGPLTHLGVPRPVRQYPVRFESKEYRIDFAFPHAMVAVEAQGYRWHSSHTAWERDIDKANAIQIAGWRGPICVTWADMRDPKRTLLHQLRRMLLPELFDG